MLYFAEGERTLSRETIERCGLAGIVERPQSRETLRGVEGHRGVVFRDTRSSGDLRVDEQRQTWVPRVGFNGCWVGVWNDAIPIERELARDKQLTGPKMKLLDGDTWQVPMLRRWIETDEGPIVFQCELPQVLRQNPQTGSLVSGGVIRPYREIWKTASEIADCLLDQIAGGNQIASLDDSLVDSFVADLLGINYRIGLSEIGLLGLLDRTTYGEIIRAAIDWPRLEAIVKNRHRQRTAGEQATSNTEFGATQPIEDSITLIGQP